MGPTPLTIGEPAPWFASRTAGKARFVFDTVGGCYVVRSFFESADHRLGKAMLRAIKANRRRFDDTGIYFFGVSVCTHDEALVRLADSIPGLRFFFDFDGSASKLYGAVFNAEYRPVTYVLDPLLRVYAALTLDKGVDAHIRSLLQVLARLPKFDLECRAQAQAPVLVLPRVFEPRFCRMLIKYYDSRGGDDSGFMRDVNGKTVKLIDYET
jgi:hypothetical protein